MFPKAEFAARIDAFWETVSDAFAGVLIYADPRHNAELAYFTNYIPRLEPALALISRKGDPIMLPSDPPNMWSAAKRVTWVENFVPLKKLNEALPAWRTGPNGGPITTLGFDAMPPGLHRNIAEALSGIAQPDATPQARMLMRKKRPREMTAIRAAAETLRSTTDALAKAQRSGANAANASLEAERAGLKAGAQDIRILYSVDGGRTLRPFAELSSAVAEPLVAYIAVRRHGYWADAFVTISGKPSAVYGKVKAALQDLVSHAKDGAVIGDLASAANSALAPFSPHAMTAGGIGSSIGLALEESPLSVGSGDTLREGGVYSLQLGASDGDKVHALVSALVAINKDGAEILWSA